MPRHLTLVPPSPSSSHATGKGSFLKTMAGAWASWRTAWKRLRSSQPIPADLLGDVLADNELRAREEMRHRPYISGQWNRGAFQRDKLNGT